MALARGKMKKNLCDSYIKYVVQPNIDGDLDHAYQTYLDMNKAHVLMTCKQGIISKETAKKLLEGTQEMAKMGDKPTFYMDPKNEGTYFNIEKYLNSLVGIEIGGQLHTARSRNDLMSAIGRVDVRRVYFELCEKVIGLRKALIALGKNNEDAVMSGYTHLQPSEPITFGHYCSAIANALERDYRRLAAAFESINICPLGGGSMGSTTWDIDREYVAGLLGFDGPIQNSIDCVASRDYMVEILAANAMLGNTITRFCQDLYVWVTPDYGYLEVDDSVAVSSSIMPQKKNPITLEYGKAKGSVASGHLANALNILKSTPYTNTCDAVELGRVIFPAMEDMIGLLCMLIDTVNTLTVKKDRMAKTALGNFCTVTELANTLVRRDRISFREAHEVLARIVDYMLTHGKFANEITTVEVNKFMAEECNGKQSSLTDEEIQTALDPVKNAMSKKITGGTAPAEVDRQLNLLAGVADKDEKVLGERVARIAKAKADLEKAVEDLIKG